VDDFLAGGDLADLPNLCFWAGGLKMVRIVERPIEAQKRAVFGIGGLGLGEAEFTQLP